MHSFPSETLKVQPFLKVNWWWWHGGVHNGAKIVQARREVVLSRRVQLKKCHEKILVT